MEELKITSKWANIIDEREYSNIKDDQKSIQFTMKLDMRRPKKVNTKYSKVITSKN